MEPGYVLAVCVGCFSFDVAPPLQVKQTILSLDQERSSLLAQPIICFPLSSKYPDPLPPPPRLKYFDDKPFPHLKIIEQYPQMKAKLRD